MKTYTELRAPHPSTKVTILLPNPEFEDTRRSETTVVRKRKRNGDVITYPKTSNRFTLSMTFDLTRMKFLELKAFLNSYQSARIHLSLYDGTTWDALLTADPFAGVGDGRIGNNALVGKESYTVTLTFSALKLS